MNTSKTSKDVFTFKQQMDRAAALQDANEQENLDLMGPGLRVVYRHFKAFLTQLRIYLKEPDPIQQRAALLSCSVLFVALLSDVVTYCHARKAV